MLTGAQLNDNALGMEYKRDLTTVVPCLYQDFTNLFSPVSGTPRVLSANCSLFSAKVKLS